MLVHGGIHHHRLNVVDRGLARVHYLKYHLAKLAAADSAILVVINEARIAYLNMRSIGKAACRHLHTRLKGHGLSRLLRTIGTRIVSTIEIIYAVITTVALVEAAHVTLLTTLGLCPTLLHSLTMLHHLLVSTLVGGFTYGATNNGTTSHADDGSNI